MTLITILGAAFGVLFLVGVVWFGVWYLGALATRPGSEMEGY